MTFFYTGPLFELFFSSFSVVDLVLRLIFALFCFFICGHLVLSKEKSVPSAERILLGMGICFLATYLYSLIAWKLSLSSSLVLSLFYLGLIAAGLRSLRKLKIFLTWDPVYLLIAAILVLGALAEIPRFSYFSEDLPQYAYFILAHIQKAMVPQDLLPLGPEPLNYPSGIGVLGLLLSKFSLGLKPLEFVYLLASIVMAVVYLGVYQRSQNKKMALFVLASLSLLCWGHVMPNRMFNGYGRAIVIPMQFYLAWLLTHRRHAKLSLIWLSSLWGLITLAINPAIAPITLCLILFVCWKTGYFKELFGRQSALKHHLAISIFGIALLFYVDPYFRAMFFGAGVPTPNMRAAGFEFSVSHAIQALFVLPFQNFSQFWQSLLHLGNTTVVFILAVLCFALSNSDIHKRFFIGSALVLLVYFVGEFFVFPESSALSLLKTYTRLTMAHFLMLLLLAHFGACLYQRFRKKIWIQNIALVILCAVGLYGFVSKAFWKRSSPQNNIAAALQSYANLGVNSPVVAIDNRERTDTGEDWIIPRKNSWLLGLLDNSKPAFFYWRGRAADYTWRSFDMRVCQKIDQAWLQKRTITHIFVAPHSTCPTLPTSEEYRLYKITSSGLELLPPAQ